MTNGNTELKLPPLSAKQLVMATFVVGVVLLGFWLLFRFYQVVLLLLAGIIVSLALEPAVKRLKARGINPGMAVGLLYGVLLLVGILVLSFGVPRIAAQADTISAQLSEGYTSIVQSLQAAPNLLIRRLAASLPSALSLGEISSVEGAIGESEPTGSFGQVLRYGGLGIMVIFQILAIFIIAFFWTVESGLIKASLIVLLPLNQREPARELITAIEQRIGAYVVGQLTVNVIMGTLATIAYLIIGLPYAPLLGLIVGIMEFIPLIGPLIGVIPALIIGFSISPTTALWTVIAAIIIHQVESNFLSPRVMRRALGMRPMVTLLALAAFGSLFGVLGVIVALPLASVLQLLFDRYLVDVQAPNGGSVERDRIGVLRYETRELIEDVHKMIRRRELEPGETAQASETVEDTLEIIAQDLDSLLAQFREPEAIS